MHEDYISPNKPSVNQVLDDVDKDKKNGIKVGTVARRIARKCNDTQKDYGVYFDKDGRFIAAKPFTATPSCGVDAYAPGHVFYVQGREGRSQPGRMTQREAQIIVNATLRYGYGTTGALFYLSLMSED